MPTDNEIRAAAERLERRLDEDPPIKMESAADLTAIAHAVDARNAAEESVRHAVEAARANGRSWNQIAIPLRVSRQSARERFADKISAR